MQTRTSIGGKDFIVEGSFDSVNTFIRIKVALEADGWSIVLPEKATPDDKEPDQIIEVWGVGQVFLTGSADSKVLKAESPIETPVYA